METTTEIVVNVGALIDGGVYVCMCVYKCVRVCVAS